MPTAELELPAMQELNRARMRELREKQELTQTQAAKRAGMIVSRWSDIETGRKANVTIETLSVIAAALGVDARELLTPKKGRRGQRE